MRILSIAIVVLGCGSTLLGQSTTTPSAGPAWGRVQALSTGTSLHVQARSKLNCRLQSVDVDSLTCRKGSRTVIFPRAEIVKIQVVKRGVSAVLGAGIGAGAGFAIDEGLSVPIFKGGHVKGSVAVAATGIGAAVLAPAGYFGGWIRETVYTAAP